MEKDRFVDLDSQVPFGPLTSGRQTLLASKGSLRFGRACVGAVPGSVGWENTDPSSAGRQAALVHEFTVARSLS